MERLRKRNPNIERIRRLRRMESFVEEQIDKYIKIHKKHEKDLSYIG
ncbi:hypothetical protein HZB88_03290 [archaeon]|nr:hypothetical protein [archaeon]